jgi:hypothetical protein
MKKEDFLRAFTEMSSEDQEAIRAELIAKGARQEVADPMAMCREMVDKMKVGGGPMEIFQEMMQKMKGKCL